MSVRILCRHNGCEKEEEQTKLMGPYVRVCFCVKARVSSLLSPGESTLGLCLPAEINTGHTLEKSTPHEKLHPDYRQVCVCSCALSRTVLCLLLFFKSNGITLHTIPYLE